MSFFVVCLKFVRYFDIELKTVKKVSIMSWFTNSYY